ncbi:MAG: tetratricopeptide repeat protein [Acidobacteriaceae bacterium]
MRRQAALLLIAAGLLLGSRWVRAQTQDPDARCASCHSQIYESWKRTPMANASGPAAQGFIAADFIHAPSGVHYRMELDHGQVWLSYERPDAPPRRALSGRQLLLYYLGSGRRGRTWIYQRDGYWYEIPINWYAKKHMWDMTPHYLQAQSMPFTLPVDPGCLHCHASDVQASLPEARNKFAGSPFPHGGITCEACHGDPARHLASGGREPILDPAQLTGLRRESICLECHLEGEVAVVKQGQKLGAFRPGDNLFDEAAYFEDGRKIGPEGRATSQWESLLESACKRASGDRLTCTTCHDPHATVAPENRVAYYRARCLSCHTGLASGHHAENPDCTACHMPRQPTEDIAHEQVTDHRIQIPGKPFHRANAGAELVAIGGSEPTPRDEGIAWAELALRGDQAAGQRALHLLLQAESTDATQASDADLHVNLGFLQQANGDPARAAAEYAQALHADPWNETAAADLAVLDARQGNLAAATLLLAKVFRDDPGASAAGVDLAVAQCRQGDSAAAAETLKRVLLFAPDDDSAQRFSLALAHGTAACSAAKEGSR